MARLWVLSLWPSSAMASDFSIVLHFFVFLSVIISLGIGVVVYLCSRRSTNILYRALLWGVSIAVVFTPVPLRDINGVFSSDGTPVFSGLLAMMGGSHRVELAMIVDRLILSIPVCVGLIALMLWGRSTAKAGSGGDLSS